MLTTASIDKIFFTTKMLRDSFSILHIFVVLSRISVKVYVNIFFLYIIIEYFLWIFTCDCCDVLVVPKKNLGLFFKKSGIFDWWIGFDKHLKRLVLRYFKFIYWFCKFFKMEILVLLIIFCLINIYADFFLIKWTTYIPQLFLSNILTNNQRIIPNN